MRLPSRVTPYRSSPFAKFPVILSALREWDMSPRALYNQTKSKTFTVADFIEVLDCLYLLGKVEFIKEKGVLHYVDGNTL